YEDLFKKNRCIGLQVYTHACLPYVTEDLGSCIFTNAQDKRIHMPWATDLLPDEIDEIKRTRAELTQKPIVSWVGSVGGGFFGNKPEIKEFKRACNENNIRFKQASNMPMEQTINFIASSTMAPALQGVWQCEKGYIPCRVFKNISY